MAEEEIKKMQRLQEENNELKARAKKLEDRITEANTIGAKIAVPVPGSFTVTLETPAGKTQKRKIKFKDGRIKCALPGGEIVSSAAVMALANGKDVDEEVINKYPALRSLDKDAAVEYLTRLAQINAGTIEDA